MGRISIFDLAIRKARSTCLFQPAYSLLPVIGIFLCTVICIADQETASASFVIFYHLAVALGLFQYPVLDFLTFILSYCCPLKLFIQNKLEGVSCVVPSDRHNSLPPCCNRSFQSGTDPVHTADGALYGSGCISHRRRCRSAP